jgi:hypothetical protein
MNIISVENVLLLPLLQLADSDIGSHVYEDIYKIMCC